MASSNIRYYIKHRKDFLKRPFSASLPKLLSLSKVCDASLSESDEPPRFHLHPHCEIFYFESGYGCFELPNEHIPLQANNLVIVNAKQLHRQYSQTSPSLVYTNLFVSSLQLNGLPQNCFSEEPYLKFSFPSKRNEVYSLLKKILKEINNPDEASPLQIDGLVCQILAEILRLKSEQSPLKDEPRKKGSLLMWEVRQYLSENYTNKISIDDIAKKFFLSKSSLCHSFRKQYEISPIQYLLELRLESAKDLLTNTELSVSEVARRTGFGNLSYFSTYFKRMEKGMSPSEFMLKARSDSTKKSK